MTLAGTSVRPLKNATEISSSSRRMETLKVNFNGVRPGVRGQRINNGRRVLNHGPKTIFNGRLTKRFTFGNLRTNFLGRVTTITEGDNHRHRRGLTQIGLHFIKRRRHPNGTRKRVGALSGTAQ